MRVIATMMAEVEAIDGYHEALARVDDSATRCLEAANRAVLELDTSVVEPAHLVLGLFDSDPAVAAAFATVGLERSTFVAGLDFSWDRYPDHGVTPPTADAQSVVVAAGRRAGHGSIAVEHLALGLIDHERESPGPLIDAGVPLDALEAELRTR